MTNHQQATLKSSFIVKARECGSANRSFVTESHDKSLRLYNILAKTRTKRTNSFSPTPYEMCKIGTCRPNGVPTVLPIEIKRFVDKTNPTKSSCDKNDPIIMKYGPLRYQTRPPSQRRIEQH